MILNIIFLIVEIYKFPLLSLGVMPKNKNRFKQLLTKYELKFILIIKNWLNGYMLFLIIHILTIHQFERK